MVHTPLDGVISTKLNALPNELGHEYSRFLSTLEGDTTRELDLALSNFKANNIC